MDALFVIGLLVAGAGVGFTNGMFGVGGCFLMVPVMFFLFKGMGMRGDTESTVWCAVPYWGLALYDG